MGSTGPQSGRRPGGSSRVHFSFLGWREVQRELGLAQGPTAPSYHTRTQLHCAWRQWSFTSLSPLPRAQQRSPWREGLVLGRNEHTGARVGWRLCFETASSEPKDVPSPEGQPLLPSPQGLLWKRPSGATCPDPGGNIFKCLNTLQGTFCIFTHAVYLCFYL